MARIRLRHAAIPAPLRGWLLVDDQERPRYWATIWADVLKAGVDDGTRTRQLAAVERLYQAVAVQTGKDRLDGMIAALDFDALESALGGLLSVLRNDSAIQGVDRDQTWASALAFVSGIVFHLAPSAERQLADAQARLLRGHAIERARIYAKRTKQERGRFRERGAPLPDRPQFRRVHASRCRPRCFC